MKSIYWKELRENVKWAAIGLITLSLGLICAWASAQDRYSFDGFKSLLHPTVLLVTMFGGPLIGIALGFLQIIPEQLRDRWAFLIHRPVPAVTIFFGKALAGMTLYLLATVPPYLYLSWWASLPGHVAGPFHPGLMLSGALNLSGGLVFYIAAIVTAMRPARWFGTKTFPLLAALCLEIFGANIGDWPAFVFFQLAAFILITLVGVRCFDVHDQITKGRRLQFGAECLVLYTGLYVLVGLAFGLLSMMQTQNYNYRSYVILGDGRIVHSVNENGVNTLKDLQGNVLPFKARYNEEDPKKRVLNWDYAYISKNAFHYFRQRGYASTERWIGPSFNGIDETTWFYLPSKGYFANYSRHDKRIKGYLSPSGFSESEPTASTRFSGLLYSLNGGYDNEASGRIKDTAYWFKFTDAKVLPLFTTHSPVNKVYTSVIGDNYESRSEDKRVFTVDLTTNQFAIYKPDGRELFRSSLSRSLKRYPNFKITKLTTEDRYFLHYVPNWREGGEEPSYMVELDATGKIVKETELPGEPRETPKWTWIQVLGYGANNLTFKSWELGSLWVRAKLGNEDAIGGWNYKKNHAKKEIHDIEILLALGLLSTGIAYRRMRRYSFPAARQRNWLLFVLLTGPIGLLTLLAQETWPVSEPCPACGKRRLITFDQCEHCGATWSAPAKDGTELITI